LVCDGDHGIAGHMSKLSDGDVGKQVWMTKAQHINSLINHPDVPGLPDLASYTPVRLSFE